MTAAATGFALYGMKMDLSAQAGSVQPKIKLKTVPNHEGNISDWDTRPYEDWGPPPAELYVVSRRCEIHAWWQVKKSSSAEWKNAGQSGVDEGDCSDEWFVRVEAVMGLFEDCETHHFDSTYPYPPTGSPQFVYSETDSFERQFNTYIVKAKKVNDAWVVSANKGTASGTGQFGPTFLDAGGAMDDHGAECAFGVSAKKGGDETTEVSITSKLSASISDSGTPSFDKCGNDEPDQPEVSWADQACGCECQLGALVFELCYE